MRICEFVYERMPYIINYAMLSTAHERKITKQAL